MSGERDEQVDWTGVDIEVARTILQQGEIYLRCQLDIALASDQRAVTVGGVFATVSTATVGGTIALYQTYDSASLVITGILMALWMGLAALFSFRAAWPAKFHIPGNHPKQWWPYSKNSIVLLIGRESEGYQTRISENNACIEKCAEKLRRGARFAVTTPIIGIMAWCVSRYLFLS